MENEALQEVMAEIQAQEGSPEGGQAAVDADGNPIPAPAAVASPAPGSPEAIAAEEAAKAAAANGGGQAAPQAAQQGPITLEDIKTGKVPAAEDLQALLALQEKLDPKTLKMVDIYQSGKQNMRSVLGELSKDYENMPLKERLFQSWLAENTDVDPDDQDEIFNEAMAKEYLGYDPSHPDLSTSKFDKREIQKRADAFAKSRMDAQEKWLDENYTPPASAQDEPEMTAEEKAKRKAERMEAVNGFKGLKHSLGKDLSIELGVDEMPEGSKDLLEKMVTSPMDYFEAEYLTPDGSKLETQKFINDMMFLKNREGALRKAYEAGRLAGGGEKAEETEVLLGRKKGPAAAQTDLEVDPEEELVNRLAAQRGR